MRQVSHWSHSIPMLLALVLLVSYLHHITKKVKVPGGSAIPLLRVLWSCIVILILSLLCDYILASQQRSSSLLPERGSLLGVLWDCHQKNQIQVQPLPLQSGGGPDLVLHLVQEVLGVPLLSWWQRLGCRTRPPTQPQPYHSLNTMSTFTLAIKAPLPLPAEGVKSVAFKAHINSLIPFLEQDVVNYFFFEDSDEPIYASWTAKHDGTRISALAATDPDKISLDAKLLANTITELEYNNKRSELLRKRNSQLSKFIHLITISTHYTEHSDIKMQSTCFAWIVRYLERHYDIEARGAHFMNVAKITYKKGTLPQTFYKQFRALFDDNLRKKGEIMVHKNNHELTEDESISSSFESTIVLWCLEKIDVRLPARVAKLYGYQMTGNKTLIDLQSTIFQNISTILADLDSEEQRSSLGAAKTVDTGESQDTQLNYAGAWDKNKNAGAWDKNKNTGAWDKNKKKSFTSSRGRGDRRPGFTRQDSRRTGSSSAPSKPFCRMCKLAGSRPSHYNSHEIGECDLLTKSDLGSIVRLNGLEEDGAAEDDAATPTPFLEPGWDEEEG